MQTNQNTKDSKVDFKRPQPKTTQKTVRVPNRVLDRLEAKAQAAEISVPKAIVQILDKWYEEEEAKGKRGTGR